MQTYARIDLPILPKGGVIKRHYAIVVFSIKVGSNKTASSNTDLACHTRSFEYKDQLSLALFLLELKIHREKWLNDSNYLYKARVNH